MCTTRVQKMLKVFNMQVSFWYTALHDRFRAWVFVIFWCWPAAISGRSFLVGLRAPKKRMSRDSLVSSMPTDGWSCGTLEEGVAKCASMAGIRLRPEDAAEASKSKSVGQGVKKGRWGSVSVYVKFHDIDALGFFYIHVWFLNLVLYNNYMLYIILLNPSWHDCWSLHHLWYPYACAVEEKVCCQ